MNIFGLIKAQPGSVNPPQKVYFVDLDKVLYLEEVIQSEKSYTRIHFGPDSRIDVTETPNKVIEAMERKDIEVVEGI